MISCIQIVVVELYQFFKKDLGTYNPKFFCPTHGIRSMKQSIKDPLDPIQYRNQNQNRVKYLKLGCLIPELGVAVK